MHDEAAYGQREERGEIGEDVKVLDESGVVARSDQLRQEGVH